MKKIGMFVFIIMMMVVVTAAQAEVRAGGLPALVVDDRISDGNAPATAPVRAGGLPAVVVDDRINDCAGPCPPPPVVEQKVEAPAPVPEPAPVQEKVSIMLNVEFDTAKAVVKDKYHDDIKRVADFMKAYPKTNAAIEGHTDNVGNAEYNLDLSQKRANSVRQYLINKFGIKASRITATGYGLTKPIASNDTEEGRQKNRRVEAVLETVHTIK